MKRWIALSGMLLAGAVVLSGCGNAIPEMDEETKAMVISYAADMVQKYDSNQEVRLQTLTVTEEEDVQEEESQISDKEEAEETAGSQEAPAQQETDPGQGAGQQTEVTDNTLENTQVTLDSFLQLDAFHFSYEGYEICDSYPTSGTEAYFSLSATAGNKLLVLKFKAENQRQTEETLDMIQTGIRCKVQTGGETKNALVTMLLNDFANYQDTVAPGESVELVVVCEISEEKTAVEEPLALVLKNAEETAAISLE